VVTAVGGGARLAKGIRVHHHISITALRWVVRALEGEATSVAHLAAKALERHGVDVRVSELHAAHVALGQQLVHARARRVAVRYMEAHRTPHASAGGAHGKHNGGDRIHIRVLDAREERVVDSQVHRRARGGLAAASHTLDRSAQARGVYTQRDHVGDGICAS